jgi:hypothetical protein
MKITIDLADTQFQATIAAAVKEKMHSLAADELEKQLKVAVETVVGTLDKRVEAVVKGLVEKAMDYSGWNKDKLANQIERQVNKKIQEIVIKEFARIFPPQEIQPTEENE